VNKKATTRRALKSDIPVMLTLIKELALYENAPDQVTNTSEMMLKDGFGIDKIYDAFVAETDGKVVGLAITFYRYSTWKGRCLYLEDLIVTETYRGIGAGQQLFTHCIDFGKMNNCKRMVWQVLDWNKPALDFYTKYGADLDGEWINGSLELELT
jgi:GNAT superfamily N-acetyltransferase